ncbi:hypothetical protein TNCV_1284891 [Trichonephila clavipes]|uniref:Uncharacterized protein n=1 Tax=Trichonephila clavipes TaxID=2585209 RepID=A0A8X6VK68_TRICX|nr:hypothetical protein TNCV_1284891 [Trichonephila clavipes]
MWPEPTDNVISWVFIALEQVFAIHSSKAAEWPGLAIGGILPKRHVRWLGESGQQPRLSAGALGLNPQWPEFPMDFQRSWCFGSRQYICQ